MKFLVSLAIVSFLICNKQAAAKDFFVSPNGSDSANGVSSEIDPQGGPFLTLFRAQQAIRDLKTAGQFTEPVTVHIAPGNYYFSKPLAFDIRDAGVSGREVTWRADQGKVFLSTGMALNNCRKNKLNLWECPLTPQQIVAEPYPPDTVKKNYFTPFHLYVDGRHFHVARWPNHDWAHIGLPLAADNKRFSSLEALPDLAATGAQINIFAGNDWLDEIIDVANILPTDNTIELVRPTAYPLTSGYRYYLQNIMSALDEPGEWFYDKSASKILFKTLSDAAPSRVVISSLLSLINIDGGHYINFDGLSISHTLDAAIKIKNSSFINLNKLDISNVDATGIQAENNDHIRLTNSYLHDLGESGVVLSGGDKTTLIPAENVVENNRFVGVSTAGILTYIPAVALSGVGGRISNNLIEHSPGNAITVSGNDHLVEKNEIAQACEQAADCGAIYDGRRWVDRGNVVRFNSFHDIYGFKFKQVNLQDKSVRYAAEGAAAVYLDDAMSGWRVYGNLFNRVRSIAVQVGGGRDNIIENNIFYDVGCAICMDARWPEFSWEPLWRSLRDSPYLTAVWREKYPALQAPMLHANWPEGNVIRRNIMVAGGDGFVLQYIAPAAENVISENVVWALPGAHANVYYNILDRQTNNVFVGWEAWKAQGVEQNSVLADPCLRINGNQAEVCASSPALGLGFTALPADIGLRTP